ncbi:histidine phosphatase family protein [Gordonia sp. CPCC 206044]|uniref:histidine phosphatase family protein n=1 Tax=Gordonia sp. CPCC 206044 TaxID=3140793 RepID=UPI003AF408DF
MTGSAVDASSKAPNWQGQRAEPTRLLLLRHGQTALSAQRRYSGRGDPALTDLGLAQADGAAARLGGRTDITAVVSSPLQRARDTAQAVATRLGIDVEVDDGFIETDFGDWEGLTFTEAAERDPRLHGQWLTDPEVSAPSGESFAQVADRVIAAKDALLQRHPGQTILVVSHVTPIKSLLRDALRTGPELLFRLHLDLASLSITEFFPDGGSVVKLVNDTGHLD